MQKIKRCPKCGNLLRETYSSRKGNIYDCRVCGWHFEEKTGQISLLSFEFKELKT